MNLKQLTGQVEGLCRDTGQFILNERQKVSQKDIAFKSLNSLVSYVDQQAEERLVRGLREILPQAGFITEEETPDEPDKSMCWIIDPLDGTTNYLHGIPVFAISVALVQNETELIGVVYELGQLEMFSAWQGGGAYINGVPIRVNGTKLLRDSLMATGFPYHDFSHMPGFMSMLQSLFHETRGVRRLGSAATDLAYVACGRFDGFFEAGLHAWDVAAGALLVKEAGGRVSDFSGGDHYIFSGEILTSSEGLYPDLLKLTRRHFKIE